MEWILVNIGASLSQIMSSSEVDKTPKEGREAKETKTSTPQVIFQSEIEFIFIYICMCVCVFSLVVFISCIIFLNFRSRFLLFLAQLLLIGLGFRSICSGRYPLAFHSLIDIVIVTGFSLLFLQAYSPMPPHGFMASSPQAHPYMWGVQV